ncbi:hypothetical protein ABZ485_35145 [Streptomyces albogriseolus]|uniref:hypothetical protein n=1 Tax=Streptomyces albogriseolus TaxID=1887 RepID=UPI003461013E
MDTDLASRADLDVAKAFFALLTAVRTGLAVKKNDVRAARGRVRQVAGLCRVQRRRQLREKAARVVPRIAF